MRWYYRGKRRALRCIMWHRAYRLRGFQGFMNSEPRRGAPCFPQYSLRRSGQVAAVSKVLVPALIRKSTSISICPHACSKIHNPLKRQALEIRLSTRSLPFTRDVPDHQPGSAAYVGVSRGRRARVVLRTQSSRIDTADALECGLQNQQAQTRPGAAKRRGWRRDGSWCSVMRSANRVSFA